MGCSTLLQEDPALSGVMRFFLMVHGVVAAIWLCFTASSPAFDSWLALVAMSATLMLTGLCDGAPVIGSEGRAFPCRPSMPSSRHGTADGVPLLIRCDLPFARPWRGRQRAGVSAGQAEIRRLVEQLQDDLPRTWAPPLMATSMPALRTLLFHLGCRWRSWCWRRLWRRAA